MLNVLKHTKILLRNKPAVSGQSKYDRDLNRLEMIGETNNGQKKVQCLHYKSL